MAGIGFELKKLFNATGVLSKLRAYGYTGMVTAGPMIMGFVFLLTLQLIAKRSGLETEDSELLTSLITYSLLASMIYSSIFSLYNHLYRENMPIRKTVQKRCVRIMPKIFPTAL